MISKTTLALLLAAVGTCNADQVFSPTSSLRQLEDAKPDAKPDPKAAPVLGVPVNKYKVYWYEDGSEGCKRTSEVADFGEAL